MKEIIWFGRGGQGAVVAAQILAESAYLEGFKGVTSAPTFGPERRGAPVTASTRISEDPNKALQAEEDIGLLLPCNVIVYEKEGTTVVGAFDPMVMTQLMGNEAMRPIAEEVKRKLERVIAAV